MHVISVNYDKHVNQISICQELETTAPPPPNQAFLELMTSKINKYLLYKTGVNELTGIFEVKGNK